MREYNGKKIVVMACSKCNINCKHCYISFKGNRDPDELLTIVKNLKTKYELNINGAEILTDINYLKSYQEIGQHYFLSNGYAIYQNPNIIDKIKDYDIKSISLSYHFGIQDYLSPMKTENIEDVIKLLHEKGIQTRLMTTITKKNYILIKEMCEKAKELECRAIKFTNYLSQGNALNLSRNNILDYDEKYYFFKQLDECRKIYDKDELSIERCGTFGKDLYKEASNFQCNCLNNSLVLTPDNKIYPCIFLAKPGYEVGVYENGKVMINEIIDNVGDSCFTDRICNQNEKVKFLRRN